MNGEDPPERPEYVSNIISGLERYNPEAVSTLENYLQEQCDEKYTDCNANRTLLKLYQLNPDRMKDEVVTNILVKAMTQFPSPQFSLALHLVSPTAAAAGELGEAVAKLRALNAQLEGARYADFWADVGRDDLCADLVADIAGFEDLVRQRIALLVSHAFRAVRPALLEAWLGLAGPDKTAHFLADVVGWEVDGPDGLVRIPANRDNEAQKAEIREDVSIEQFSRVIRRTWEEVAA